MLARSPEIPGADAQGDLAEFEVVQELVPFFGAEIPVFFAGTQGAAAGDEGPVVGDDVLGVDRLWRTQISELSECLSIWA